MNDSNNNENMNIDDIFDECLEAVLIGAATIEACLERHPAHAEELQGLLSTSLAIARSPELDPTPGARMRIRVALNEKMAEWAKPKPKPFWRLGWANAVATFVLGLSLTGGGLAYAASGSMPGQTLYDLKLGMEQALVAITPGDDARIELYAALNDRRVDEIVYLASIGDSLTIVEVTGRLQDNFTAAAALKGFQFDATAGILAAPPSFEATVPGIATTPDATDIRTETKNLSTSDTNLENYKTSQLNNLASNVPTGASPAVQAAMDQAAAIIRAGYDALLNQTE
ncbi:DUF5667 domain-containing protein [Dehalogenimonas sp. THU2]|uniref:DUF5667 domain-containing protein n=1 Tax=Dehalogenimonas sp. THU2 TaxID=3151121 RepID=UPI003218AD30